MKKIVFYCVVLLAIVTGCGKATSPGNDSVIYGTVLDTEGNPVENAKILVNFHIDSDYPIESKFIFDQLIDKVHKAVDDSIIPPINYGIQQNCPNPFTSITQICFCLENSSIGSLWGEDMLGNEIEILIENQIFISDQSYCINWNGKDNDENNIQNGLYKVLLDTDYESYIDTLFVYKDYTEFIYEYITSLCMSNNSGEFTIQSDDLSLNYVGDQYDENGNPVGDFTVTPYIDIWAFHPDYNAVHIDSLEVKSGKDVHVSLSFE